MIPFQLHRRIPLVRRPFFQRDQALALADDLARRLVVTERQRDEAIAERDRSANRADELKAERDHAYIRIDRLMAEARVENNVAGHRAKYDHLMQHMPAKEAGETYVGGGDPIVTGFHELETLRSLADLSDAVVVDVGCGIGRLTQHLVDEPIRRYFGIDVIPEVLQQAEATVAGDPRFRFAIGSECKIAERDATIDIVAAFSLITHLLDEETYQYLAEASRVLRSGGIAVFSFLDFAHPFYRDLFFRHASQHRGGHGDLLRFNTEEVLRLLGTNAGFREIEFADGMAARPLSGRQSRLLDVQALPPTYQSGQSLCILRK
jgi:SAM-dependent methyltransferase